MRNPLRRLIRAGGGLARGLLHHPFLVVPFAFYYYTSAPGIGSSDTALIVDEMRRLDLSTHVNHHNLTLIVGWLFSFLPGPDPARLANLACVFLGGCAASLFYWLVYHRCRTRLTAVAATTCLAVSHSFWWHSTVAEVYAMNAVLVVAALTLLQSLQKNYSDRKLAALFLLSGLALYNHIQMGILVVAACAYLAGHLLIARERGEIRAPRRLIALSVGSFLVGFLPYAATFVVDVVRRGGVATALSDALGGDFRSVMLRGTASGAFTDLGYLLGLQFPTPFLAAALAGVFILARRWKGTPSLLAITVAFALNTAFFAFYGTWDKFAFLLPSFIMLAFAGSFAVEEAVEWLRARRSRPAWALAAVTLAVCAVVPPFFYSRLVSLAPAGGVFARYSNEDSANVLNLAEYVANPDKRNYREFEMYVRALFERLPRDAVYVDDDGRAYYPVRYFQRYRRWRPDVQAELVNSWGFSGWGLEPDAFARLLREAYLGNRPLYLVSIQAPFDRLIEELPGADRLRFRRFPLDEHRWIYRLVTASEEDRLPPEPPPSASLVVGRAPRRGEALVRRKSFGPEDSLVAALLFEPNGEPFPLRFRWRSPGAQEPILSDEFHVPFGCMRAWSALDERAPLAQGRWTVEAWMGDVFLARTDFWVEATRASAPAGPAPETGPRRVSSGPLHGAARADE
jgi:hypothetical protein